jgi:hypothetical protein
VIAGRFIYSHMTFLLDRTDTTTREAFAEAARAWRALDDDWQAVVLGALVTLLVALGVDVPW